MSYRGHKCLVIEICLCCGNDSRSTNTVATTETLIDGVKDCNSHLQLHKWLTRQVCKAGGPSDCICIFEHLTCDTQRGHTAALELDPKVCVFTWVSICVCYITMYIYLNIYYMYVYVRVVCRWGLPSVHESKKKKEKATKEEWSLVPWGGGGVTLCCCLYVMFK